MKTVQIIGTAIMATILFVGCCNCGKRSSFPFEDTLWQLEQLNGKAVKAQDDNLTVAFMNTGRMAGKGSCNSFFGPWEYADETKSKIKNGPVAATKMACLENAAIESEFFRMLEEVTEYRMEETKLHLYTGDTLRAILEGSNKRIK